jgi:hypothetical protein
MRSTHRSMHTLHASQHAYIARIAACIHCMHACMQSVPAYRHAKSRIRDHVHAYTFVRKRHCACASARLPCMLARARSRACGLRPTTGACVVQNGKQRSRATHPLRCTASTTRADAYAPRRCRDGLARSTPSAPLSLIARLSSAALY